MKYLLSVMLLCCVLSSKAQLSGSPDYIPYTYVYKIPDKVLLSLYKETRFRPDIFKTPVDSFLEEPYEPPPGNYLYVKPAGTSLLHEIRCYPNSYLSLVNGPKGYKPIVYDIYGQEVHDATIVKKRDVLLVTYQGILNAFRIKNEKVAYQGKMAVSKFVYYLNDSIQFKAFVTDAKGHPLTTGLQLHLDLEDGGMLKTIYPYLPGRYAYKFTRQDNMPFNRKYSISLRKDGATVVEDQFLLLSDKPTIPKLHLQVSSMVHQRHEPVILHISGAVHHAPVKVVVKSTSTYECHGPEVFVADTLWQHTVMADAAGDVQVQLPDSIFPAAEIGYTISCQDSVSRVYSAAQHYSDAVRKISILSAKDSAYMNMMIRMQPANDSIYINMMMGGQAVNDTGTLYLYNDHDQMIRSVPINMPMVFPLQSFVSKYLVRSGPVFQLLERKDLAVVDLFNRYTHDSIFFKVDETYKFTKYYSELYYSRHPTFQLHERVALDYDYWQPRVRLDTIPWFPFISPAPIYRMDEPVDDSVTQIAPYLFNKHQYIKPQIVYIDHIPVYFVDSEQERTYSFPVTPGLHQVQIRTTGLLITYDSMIVHKGVKNFVSIDPSMRSKYIRVEKRSNYLSQEEADVLNLYMVKLSTPDYSELAYLSQGDHLVKIDGVGFNLPKLVGPITGPTIVTLPNQYSQTFTPRKNHLVSVSSDSVMFIPIDPIFSTLTKLMDNGGFNSPGDRVLTSMETIANEESSPVGLFPCPADAAASGGLIFSLDSIDAAQHVILRKKEDTCSLGIYKSIQMFRLDAGVYQATFRYKNGYFIQDDITVKNGATTYYQISDINWRYDDILNPSL